MTWARLDDSHLDHEKFMALSTGLTAMQALAAYGLWCRTLTWSAKHLTDGFLPEDLPSACSRLAPALLKPLLSNLLSAKGRSKHALWLKVEGGYQIHDFTQWNRTRQEYETFRQTKVAAGREGGRRSGEARRQARASDKPSKPEASAEASAGHLRNSRPYPTTKPPYPLEADALKNPRDASASQDTKPYPNHNPFNIPDDHAQRQQWELEGEVNRQAALRADP